ncbi:homeobox protein Hox-B9 isoform X2 [Eschrichtius robustus]|uniref:homeobox protein Hox-B9 isoform X2 n=1 Tax=Eschrichtius robustus TaxID=9764 RepID=UPI0035C01FEA
MSISGTLSSYYVDSIISHESEDAPPAKFPSGQYASPRQPGHAEHLEFPSCSFQPKAPVFGASWAPLSPHASGSLPSVYHPYIQPQGVPPAESRYLRTWLEPAPRGEAAPAQGQAAVKAEPLLGAPGELLKQGTPEYSLETSAGREAVLSNQRPGYGDNKICEGSEDKERPDQNCGVPPKPQMGSAVLGSPAVLIQPLGFCFCRAGAWEPASCQSLPPGPPSSAAVRGDPEVGDKA